MAKNKKSRRDGFSPAVLPMYIFTVVFVAIPILYVVVMSFMTRAANWGVIYQPTLAAYKKIFDPVYLKVFAQSLKVAVLTTFFTLFIGYPFAYYTAKLPHKWRNNVMLLVVVPFWTNSLVRIYGWMILLQSKGPLNTLMISLGLIDRPAKLLYNFGAVLVGMIYALIPFMILSIYNSVLKMDWALVEAARDLGASSIKAFWSITIPMTAPGIMAGCILVFIPSVGLFFVSDLLGGSKTVLLGNLIKNELLVAHNWPGGAALSIVMMAMTLLLLGLYKKVTGESDLEGLI